MFLKVWQFCDYVYRTSITLEHIFRIDIITYEHVIGVINWNETYSYVNVAPECTSLKQWLHWVFLMLLFPGPWKHKLWYIPLGLVIIEWVNVIRVVGITLCMIPFPGHFDFFHDYVFKTMFYLFIFIMCRESVGILKQFAAKNYGEE